MTTPDELEAPADLVELPADDEDHGDDIELVEDEDEQAEQQ